MSDYSVTSYLFFDKKGQQHSFDAAPGVDELPVKHIGKLYMPEISTNLIENGTMYMLSKYIVDDVLRYGAPVSNSTPALLVKFAKQDGIFKLFTVDINKEKPDIVTHEQILLPVINDMDFAVDEDGNIIELVGGTRPFYFIQDTISFNYMAMASEEGMYENQLQIFISNGGRPGAMIASFDINVAVVDEDERLTTILSNFGETIDDETFKIFADTDINDAFHDNRVLNRRMKELIVEFGNIFPNTSSLRGLSNILKFLGYADMRVKEYWLDTVSNKFVKREVGLGIHNPDKKLSVLRKPYRKLPYFGLYYDLNKPVGTYDDKGLPDMVDDLYFTKEEIIIKLFGLKNYIETRNIGGISKIKDIIGEANYYHEVAFYHDVERSELIANMSSDYGMRPKVAIAEKVGYIHDLRKYLYRPDVNICLLPYHSTMDAIPEAAYVHYNCILGNFDGGYGLPEGATVDQLFFEDNYDIPIGFLLQVENKTFDLLVRDITSTFADIAAFPVPVTIENLGSINYYKIRWEVERVDNDGRPFFASFQGPILDSSRYFNVILPFDGKYRLRMVLYGYGNNNIYYESEEIEVRLQQIDCTGFFQEYSKAANQLANIKTPIGEMKGRIGDIIWPVNPEPIPERVEFRSYNLARYMDLNQYGDPNIGVKQSYPLNRLDVIFADMGHLRLCDFSYEKERMADTNVIKVIPGGKISVDGIIIDIPPDININDFRILAEIIWDATGIFVTHRQGEDADGNAINFIDIRKDDYLPDESVAAFDMWSGSNNLDDMSCIGDTYRTIGEMNVPIGEVRVPFATTAKIFRVKRKVNPFNAGNVWLSQDTLDIHRFTCVFFQDDISPALGRKAHKWSIYSEDDGEFIIQDVEYKYFNYRFENIGYYTIILHLEDTNGNKYDMVKKNFVRCVS